MYTNLENAINLIKQGKMVILVDARDREDEGDFVMSGALTTPDDVNFIITNARGILCQAIDESTAKRLGFKPMVDANTSVHSTAFTVSVDAVSCKTTGVSAEDRAITINKISDSKAVQSDFLFPGHLFPLIAKPKLLKERQGHTEGVVYLMHLAGFNPPTGILCEILNEDGTMARRDDLVQISKKFSIPILDISELIEYSNKN